MSKATKNIYPFVFKCEYFDDVSGEVPRNILTDYGLQYAHTYKQAVEIIENYYGGIDNINELKLDVLEPYPILLNQSAYDEFMGAYGSFVVLGSSNDKPLENNTDNLYSLDDVAEIMRELFEDDCPCNFNNVDTWLPYVCKYGNTCCPNPTEKLGCWKEYILNRKARDKTLAEIENESQKQENKDE